MESSWKGVIILQYSISLHSLQSKNKYQLFLPNSSTPLSNCIVDALLNHIPLNVSFFAISVHLIIKFSDAENAQPVVPALQQIMLLVYKCIKKSNSGTEHAVEKGRQEKINYEPRADSAKEIFSVFQKRGGGFKCHRQVQKSLGGRKWINRFFGTFQEEFKSEKREFWGKNKEWTKPLLNSQSPPLPIAN